jgi:hypothetical protein
MVRDAILLRGLLYRTLIAGVPTRHRVKKSGRSFRSGCGICVRNSVRSGSLPQCVSLSFPPPRTEALPSPTPSPTRPSFGPPQWARAARVGSLGGEDFLPLPDGTLRCQQGAILYPQERRPEHDGTVRVIYAARIADCRCCPIRAQCQGHGTSTKKPRRVSAVLHPLPAPEPEEQPLSWLAPCSPYPVLWGDWSRCQPRRAWIGWLRSHLVTVQASPIPPSLNMPSSPLSRAERAHWRLTWQQRLARNVRPPTAPPVEITLSGLSPTFAQTLGLRVA